jgi:glycosyltransferase involved in cell wall biosynthesis
VTEADLDRCRSTDHRSLLDESHRIAATADLVAALRASARLAGRVKHVADPAALVAGLSGLADADTFSNLVSIEALARVPHQDADEVLLHQLENPNALVRRHAAWRLGHRAPDSRAYPQLFAELVGGGIATMHSHRTLRRWSIVDQPAVSRMAIGALAGQGDPAARSRIVDLLGVVADRGMSQILMDLATDTDEDASVRIAAIGALGERLGASDDAVLRGLARSDDEVGGHAALALSSAVSASATSGWRAGGLRIAQLVLAGELDGQLSLGGRGETGGVASLLVSLGEALARRTDVDHVVTIGRGSVTDALTSSMCSGDDPLSYGMIAIGDPARPAGSPQDIWEHLPAIERGIRRALRCAGPVDLLHLRMADAGTLAGADVAAALDIPICFSLAPDPYNVIESLQSRGELDRVTFDRLDTEQHVWFRARMVERLARRAERVALFPRVRPWEFFEDAIAGTHVADQRVAVVAEGIDVALLRRTAEGYSSDPSGVARRRDVLDELAARIPDQRRALPLLLSVGRLHPVKGMDRVVRAWASDPALHASCNLVMVGGELDDPSRTERDVLAAIDRAVPTDDSRRSGLVMLGGRPHADVARLQVAAALGRVGSWLPGGVYVDGALKEEFGLAVLEALAAGLVVVAPSTGGPATYVDHGDTGILVHPGADLGRAIHDALGLVDRPGRAQRARAMVEDRYSIDTMAARLTELYRPVAARR